MSATSRTVLSELINEGTTPTLSFTIVDHDGQGFKPETLALTYYDYRGETIINGRDSQNVLDTNGAETAGNGETTFQLTKEDSVIVHSDSRIEVHIGRFDWTWNGGLFVGSHEFELHFLNQVRKG